MFPHVSGVFLRFDPMASDLSKRICLFRDHDHHQIVSSDSRLHWDVNNGVARRAWARNENARLAIERDMELNPLLRVTLPNLADDASVRNALSKLQF